MSPDEPRDDEVTYGRIRRCIVHPVDLDCQASRDDCLVELMPTRPPKVEMIAPMTDPSSPYPEVPSEPDAFAYLVTQYGQACVVADSEDTRSAHDHAEALYDQVKAAVGGLFAAGRTQAAADLRTRADEWKAPFVRGLLQAAARIAERNAPVGAAAGAEGDPPKDLQIRTEYGVEVTYPDSEPIALPSVNRYMAEKSVRSGNLGGFARHVLVERTTWSTPWVPAGPADDGNALSPEHLPRSGRGPAEPEEA